MQCACISQYPLEERAAPLQCSPKKNQRKEEAAASTVCALNQRVCQVLKVQRVTKMSKMFTANGRNPAVKKKKKK